MSALVPRKEHGQALFAFLPIFELHREHVFL
jgi:hypothetical protein